jgi:hypothetical protein
MGDGDVKAVIDSKFTLAERRQGAWLLTWRRKTKQRRQAGQQYARGKKYTAKKVS